MGISLADLTYVRKDSPVHRLHPATKIVIFITTSLFIFGLSEIYQALIVLIGTIIFFLLAKLPKRVLKLIANVAILFGVMITVSFLITYRAGTPVYWIGGFAITDKAIYLVILLNIRMLSLEFLGLVFFTTTHYKDIILGLRKLHVPYLICLTIALFFRFIPTVSLDLATITDAQRSRGFALERASAFQRMKRIIVLMVPLLITSFRRIEITGRALEARAFDFSTSKTRTYYFDIPLSKTDYLIIFFFIALMILVFLQPYMGIIIVWVNEVIVWLKTILSL